VLFFSSWSLLSFIYVWYYTSFMASTSVPDGFTG
jgi:hypothetical protein